MMGADQNQLPVETDFLDPRSQDLDERHALKMFHGKTAEQAEIMFRENFLFYYEDLTYMRATAFCYYVLPAIRYLLSDAAKSDSDAVSTFCHVLESRHAIDPDAMSPIFAIVLDAIGQILARFGRFDCNPEIYGDVPGRFLKVAAQLRVSDAL